MKHKEKKGGKKKSVWAWPLPTEGKNIQGVEGDGQKKSREWSISCFRE